jgi:hypothetical protein
MGQGLPVVRGRFEVTRAQLQAYLDAHGFKRAQDRIGIEVYRADQGKRSKLELTIAGAAVYVYDLKRGRKRIQEWSLQ